MSDAITADLAALSAALDEPGIDLALLVQRLGDSCALAITSYLGFSITLDIGRTPISFTVLEEFLDPSEILTSLRFELSAGGDPAAGGEMILYAGTAGAFVDLAADLTFTRGAGPGAVRLDEHLMPPNRAPGGTRVDTAGSENMGLARMSRQNQALGILLDQGLDLDDGLAELQRLARLGEISVDAAAQQLLDATVQPPPG